MAPKFDPNEIKIGKEVDSVSLNELLAEMLMRCDTFTCVAVYLRATGGEVGATSSLAPKIGPLGLVSWKFLKESDDTFRQIMKSINTSERSIESDNAWHLREYTP